MATSMATSMAASMAASMAMDDTRQTSTQPYLPTPNVISISHSLRNCHPCQLFFVSFLPVLCIY